MGNGLAGHRARIISESFQGKNNHVDCGMNKKHLAVVGFFCVVACAPAAAQMGGMGGGGGAPGGMAGQVVLSTPEGETMVVPLPNNWTPYAREAEQKDERYIFPSGQEPSDWRETLRQETYHTTAGVTSAERVYELRIESDPNSCESFTSRKLGEGPENGYSMVFWRQVCGLADGQTLASLNKAVLGNDQLHIISMIWKQDPPTRAWTQWTNYMGRVYVCDTEREEHPCQTAPPPGRPGGMRR